MPRIVFGMLLILWITTLPYAHITWGKSSVLTRAIMADRLIPNLIFHLFYHPAHFIWIYCLHAIVLVLSLWNHRFVFVARLIAWITGVMLYQTAPGIFGIGIFLILNTAFLMIPVYYGSEHRLRRWLNSIAFGGLRLQGLLVLFAVTLFMWGSRQWRGGLGFYYLFHQPDLVRAFVITFTESKSGIIQSFTTFYLVLVSVLPGLLIARATRSYTAFTLLGAALISFILFQHVTIGFCLALIALPWIDATKGSSLTSIPQ